MEAGVLEDRLDPQEPAHHGNLPTVRNGHRHQGAGDDPDLLIPPLMPETMPKILPYYTLTNQSW